MAPITAMVCIPKNNEPITGGFLLELLLISWVISHMTCHKFECSHGWIFFFIKNPLQDLALVYFSAQSHFFTPNVLYWTQILKNKVH